MNICLLQTLNHPRVAAQQHVVGTIVYISYACIYCLHMTSIQAYINLNSFLIYTSSW